MQAKKHYEPTKMEMVVGLLSKTASSETNTSVHALSVRIPTIQYAAIEAMAQYSGISRNKVICELLDLAITNVLQEMESEHAEGIEALRAKLLMELVMDGQGNFARLAQADKGEC